MMPPLRYASILHKVPLMANAARAGLDAGCAAKSLYFCWVAAGREQKPIPGVSKGMSVAVAH